MGTHYKGSKEQVQALDTYIKLVRVTESIVARLSHQLRSENDLTLSQFGALESLLHLGDMSQSELGHKLLKSSGNITMVVDNLEKRGLVQRCRDTGDRRLVMVRLTAVGRELIAGVFPAHAQAITEEMGHLSQEEQGVLGVLCKKLGVRS